MSHPLTCVSLQVTISFVLLGFQQPVVSLLSSPIFMDADSIASPPE